MKFNDLVNDYIRSPVYTKLSKSSFRLYFYALRNLCEYFGDKELSDIKRSDLIRFINDNASRPGTANLCLRVASVVFSFAMDLDEIPYNPAAKVRKLKGGNHTRWFVDEVKKVISDHDRTISTSVALAWYTGQRECDVLNMRWGDIKDGYVSLVQQKTKLEMTIKIPDTLNEFLTRIRGEEPDSHYIVSGKKRLSGQAFRGRFKRAMDRLGIEKVFHGIRKGVASDLAENGRSSKEIAALLGHKTPRMVDYYTSQADSKKLTSVAVDSITDCI